MKRWPVICPKGARVIITQGFKPTHDAVDFVIWNDNFSERENYRLSYGSQLVCPVPEAKCVLINDFGTMNPLGNGVDIEWQEDGFYWRLHFWHTVYNELLLNQLVKEGELIGLIGNTGDCRPVPTANEPYEGTHCHMRLSRYHKDAYGFGNIDIESLDPRFYFDILSPYVGNDSNVVVDLQPIYWAWGKLGIISTFDKLMYLLLKIFK